MTFSVPGFASFIRSRLGPKLYICGVFGSSGSRKRVEESSQRDICLEESDSGDSNTKIRLQRLTTSRVANRCDPYYM